MMWLSLVPWRLIGYAVVALALGWVLWRVRLSYTAEAHAQHVQAGYDAYRQTNERNARLATIQAEKDQRRDAALTSRLTALQADNAALRRALARVPATVEKPDANGVPHLVVAGDWWLCHAAQLGRDPADIAACEARAGDGGVQNAVGDGRLPVSP